MRACVVGCVGGQGRKTGLPAVTPATSCRGLGLQPLPALFGCIGFVGSSQDITLVRDRSSV